MTSGLALYFALIALWFATERHRAWIVWRLREGRRKQRRTPQEVAYDAAIADWWDRVAKIRDGRSAVEMDLDRFDAIARGEPDPCPIPPFPRRRDFGIETAARPLPAPTLSSGDRQC